MLSCSQANSLRGKCRALLAGMTLAANRFFSTPSIAPTLWAMSFAPCLGQLEALRAHLRLTPGNALSGGMRQNDCGANGAARGKQ